MEHKKKRAVNVQEPPATVPALAAHLETFAKAVAEGTSHIKAAVTCGRRPGSASFLYAQPGVKERIAELRTLAKNATEKAVTENAIRVIRKITFDRNDIIMGIHDDMHNGFMPVNRMMAKLKGWSLLADIFLLRAKTLQDLANLHGWTTHELDAFIETRTIPERFRSILIVAQIENTIGQESLRTEKLAGGPGGAGLGGGGNP